MRGVKILALGSAKGNCYPHGMLIFLFLSQFLWSATPKTQALQGHWVQPCQTQTIRAEVFAGTSVSLIERYNYRPDCSEPLMEIQNIGTFTTEGRHMDFTFERITITLWHDLMIQDFNGRSVCGFSDWKIGETRDVTGMYCALITGGKPVKISDPGSQRFGIYKIEKEKLYFGQLEPGHDALTPEKRPVHFDPRFYIKEN